MDKRLLRPLLIVEFLIAVQAVFTIWSEAGGQYDLDLMFWPWKLGIGLAASALIVAITANLARNEGKVTRRALLFATVLIATALLAGMVTYYYHLNEPQDDDQDQDQDQDQDDDPATLSLLIRPAPQMRLTAASGLPSHVTTPGTHSRPAPSAALPCN